MRYRERGSGLGREVKIVWRVSEGVGNERKRERSVAKGREGKTKDIKSEVAGREGRGAEEVRREGNISTEKRKE